MEKLGLTRRAYTAYATLINGGCRGLSLRVIIVRDRSCVETSRLTHD